MKSEFEALGLAVPGGPNPSGLGLILPPAHLFKFCVGKKKVKGMLKAFFKKCAVKRIYVPSFEIIKYI